MAESEYLRYPDTTIPGCTCTVCSLARASLANRQPTDEELADAVRKSVHAMASAVWEARNRGITVDFNVQTETEGSYWPVRAIPGTFVLRSIYRETTETVPASTKTVRVNL